MSKNIGENIRRFRKFKGLTQEELGNLVGKKKAALSLWEIGKNEPSIADINALCKALDTTPNELFGWTENEKLAKWESETTETDKRFLELTEKLRELEQRVSDIEKSRE